ncbi:MAG: polyisoprenoid-binding protein, partial [Candidatus Hydrogenedentes bacterium]|nr:polyisoprenoid-binding protein [Candidatus Hydrogenedentota bacterium]
SATIEIKTESIDTGNEARDKHLGSADYFDVAKLPTMTFKSTACKKKDDDSYEIAGDLTIHGVTKAITIEAELVGIGKGLKGEQRAGFETSFTIDRNDFGITSMPYAIGAEVKIQIAIEGIKK